MDQKEFDRLLERYLDGDVTERERNIIDQWYCSIDPASPVLTNTEKDVIRRRIESSLNDLKERTRPADHQDDAPVKVFPFPGGLFLRIAASIVLLSVAFLFFLKDPSEERDRSAIAENAVRWEEVLNSETTPRLITLQDGSEVTLDPGGLLAYPARFDSVNRTVRLKKGKALFDIQKDASRPFYVYSYDVVTRVLGTSFTIDSNQQGRVTVDVRTGIVSVSHTTENQQAKADEVILVPNQRADYDPQANKIVRTLVEKPQVLISEAEVKNMVFEKASIPTVFKAIERAYRVKIEFDEETFSKCELTTYLIPGEDLYTRLRIICQAINARYRVDDVNIVISGKGC